MARYSASVHLIWSVRNPEDSSPREHGRQRLVLGQATTSEGLDSAIEHALCHLWDDNLTERKMFKTGLEEG